MPIITNFGDVVTVGNAAVNGTGTSSFAGPVTFAQGVSITGAVSTSSAFYGVLAGANVAAVSALTASTNVYAPIVTTPISNAATSIATTGFYGALVGQNVASVTVLTASGNVNAPTINVSFLNVSTQANVTFLNVSSGASLFQANVLTANITSSNVLTENVSTLNVSGFATLSRMNVSTANVTSLNVSTQANITFLNVSSGATLFQANVLTANITSSNVLTENVATLNVSGSTTLFQANVLTANLTSLNVSTQANVTSLNVSGTAFLSNANVATLNVSFANVTSLNVTGDANIANVTVRSNLYTSNIIMSSNLSTNTGYGNVYLTGNLVVAGNIYSIGGSVGSGSGTSQGILYSLGSNYSLGAAFATGSAGPGISGYHINLSGFTAEAVASVSAFSAVSGMLKFATGGLYQVTCVVVGDQPVAKIAIGKTSSSSFPPSVTATAGYDYVYNYPVGSSPSEIITIPLTVQDVTQYYYLDVFFSTVAASPTVLYPTRSTTAVGSAYGTYVQVGPFGNYLTSATGVASGLLMNCYGTTTLSSPVTSNTFRLAMTSSNGWTVAGVSSSLTVTSGGNFQVSQVGIYEVSMCLNPSVTPMMFGVGALATDTAPVAQGPYLYQYAPMYTQDPTTVVTLPLNITDTSKYYYLDVIFPGTQATVTLSNVSTFVSLKPVGSYVSPSTNPWAQQGTSVTYSGGAVGIGGVNPSLLTETFTVNGNTSFVGNVSVVSDASSNNYVLARRVPAGSLAVSNYVTGSVPLTTTTNLIQNYLSNAAAITANTSTGTITQALYLPGTASSWVNFPSGGQSVALSNLATSNLFIEAWINPATSPQGGIICRANGTGPSNQDFRFFIASGGILTFGVLNSGGTQFTASNATALVAGTWYHVVGCYQATSLITGTVRVFTNGGIGGTTGSLTTTQPRLTAGTNIYIGTDVLTGGSASGTLSGNVADVRVFSGSLIVPTATFASPASAPFTQSAPSYVTNMGLVGTANTVLALQSQYFPGASTSPYGPCLTLPGTLGSYYSQTNSAMDTNWRTSGFCLEAWVNYASFANATNGGTNQSSPAMIAHGIAYSYYEWGFGVTNVGGVCLYLGGPSIANTAASVVTTGTWNHVMVQGNGSNIYMAVNGTFLPINATYSPAGGNNTIAPTQPSVLTVTAGTPWTIGATTTNPGPNFAIAKARLTFGTSGNPALGNVYSSGNFTANPNFATVPAGATIAWSLDSQYPLPTYPSIQDVTPLALQSGSYGAVPTPVGGVTSNTIGPLTAYPAFDSIRFDGTGYIDFGANASSALTTNLWATPWTIEGWVYLPSAPVGNYPGILSRSSSVTVGPLDWSFYMNAGNPSALVFAYGTSGSLIYNFNASVGVSPGTWTHVAATYDGTRSNVYVNGALSNSMTATTSSMTFTPTYGTAAGAYTYGAYLLNGNLADVRVSNVARYGGTTYTVPTAPFSTDSSTLLLLKSLGGQVGTTLEVQGRGLNAVSLGATRSVQSYPPAPMSSYLLDTTGNTFVTYGQGKYVASASSENAVGSPAWTPFSKNLISGASQYWQSPPVYGASAGGPYTGSVTTIDTLGNSYAGEWIQLQVPVSLLVTSMVVYPRNDSGYVLSPTKFFVLGSRDGINWTLVNTQTGITWAQGVSQTFSSTSSQAYTFYRLVCNSTAVNSIPYNSVCIQQIYLNGTEESLCVTSDSKVGVGIANPQRALEVAGDLVVSGTISGGAGLGSFRNRIINGDMRIAQRGTSNVVPSTGSEQVAYMIDRWASDDFITTGSITQTQQTLAASDTPYQLGLQYSLRHTATVGVTSYLYYGILQRLEAINVSDLMWGTSFGQPVTVSFWFRTNAPPGSSMNICIRSAAYNVNFNQNYTALGGGQWQYVTITVPPPPNGTSWATHTTLYVGGLQPGGFTATPGWSSSGNNWGLNGTYPWAQNAGNYIEFTGVQLEKGTVATGFEFRNYAQELALCQRYYTQLGGQSTYNAFGVGIANQATTANIRCFLPVPMRSPANATATGVSVGNMVLNGNVAGTWSTTTVTAINWNYQNINEVGITATVAGGLGINWPYILAANNSLAPLIQINNEL
jgi:hypothetical protein